MEIFYIYTKKYDRNIFNEWVFLAYRKALILAKDYIYLYSYYSLYKTYLYCMNTT